VYFFCTRLYFYPQNATKCDIILKLKWRELILYKIFFEFRNVWFLMKMQNFKNSLRRNYLWKNTKMLKEINKSFQIQN